MTWYSGYYTWWIAESRRNGEIRGFDSALLNRFVNLEKVINRWRYNDILLDFSWNDKLREIHFFRQYCENESVRTIDLRGCEVLTEIICDHFPNLLSIDLSDCKELRYLSFDKTPLTSIDLSYASNLENLTLMDTNIKYLDLTNNPRIQEFLANSIEKVTLNRFYSYAKSLIDTLRKNNVSIEYK